MKISRDADVVSKTQPTNQFVCISRFAGKDDEFWISGPGVGGPE